MKALAVTEPEQTSTVQNGLVLSPEQQRARRRRNIAIGVTVGLLAILFYVVTIAKLGPGMFNRPL